MAVPLAEQIIGMCKEGLSAYKTFLATRQEAYNRHADKRQVKAIESAEKYIFNADELVAKMSDDDKIRDRGLLKEMVRYRKRFFHYH